MSTHTPPIRDHMIPYPLELILAAVIGGAIILGAVLVATSAHSSLPFDLPEPIAPIIEWYDLGGTVPVDG